MMILPGLAEAEPNETSPQLGSQPEARKQEYIKYRYGEQTLLLDGVAIAFAATAAVTNDSKLLAPALINYGIGPPAIHWAHRNVAKGFISLGLRTLPGLIGLGLFKHAYSGYSDEEPRHPDSLRAAIVLIPLSILTVIVVDSAVLAAEYVPVAPKRPLTWAPIVAPSQNAAWVGLRGLF